MKYLLDTHTFIWALVDQDKLPSKVMNIIEDTDNDVFLSSISFWEIAIKHQIGKMDLSPYDIRHLPNLANQMMINVISPDAIDYINYSDLPLKPNHHDPFDRMLIHTAIRNNYVLLSKDEKFLQYQKDGLQLVW